MNVDGVLNERVWDLIHLDPSPDGRHNDRILDALREAAGGSDLVVLRWDGDTVTLHGLEAVRWTWIDGRAVVNPAQLAFTTSDTPLYQMVAVDGAAPGSPDETPR